VDHFPRETDDANGGALPAVTLLAGRPVGVGHAPFIIAELSGNHGGSLERALAVVDAAADAGADAIKLQTYTADTMTIDHSGEGFVITDADSPWCGERLYQLYARAHTPWEWHAPLFARARERGLVAFSTPFDPTAVEFLESLDVPMYKVASFENTDLPLIRAVAATGKPLLLSTGMATMEELREAVDAAREAGCRTLVLMKCTSSYPASARESNLASIGELRRSFNCEVGLSDHTTGIGVAIASVALGAAVIEKHVTLSRYDETVDGSFSLEPGELAQLVIEARAAAESVGGVHFGPTESERSSLVFRRSLYVTADVRAGERFSAENLRAIRPGFGLPPKHLPDLIGRRAARDVARGTPAAWEMFADVDD
jgi:pseudaminic acid synthase